MASHWPELANLPDYGKATSFCLSCIPDGILYRFQQLRQRKWLGQVFDKSCTYRLPALFIQAIAGQGRFAMV